LSVDICNVDVIQNVRVKKKKNSDNPFSSKTEINHTADWVQMFFNRVRTQSTKTSVHFHLLPSGKTRADYFKPDVIVVGVTRHTCMGVDPYHN